MKITGLQKGTDKWTFIYWKIITEEVKEKWKINKRILNIREEFKKLSNKKFKDLSAVEDLIKQLNEQVENDKR